MFLVTYTTEQGQNHHVSSAKSCAWYKKGKLAEVTAPEEDMDELEPGASGKTVIAILAHIALYMNIYCL